MVAMDISEMAREVTRYGQRGDTVLAHINEQEAALLDRLYGSDVNPDTGLPQFGWLQDLSSDFSMKHLNPVIAFRDPHKTAEEWFTKGAQSKIGPTALSYVPYVGPLLSAGAKDWLEHEKRKGVYNGQTGQTPIVDKGAMTGNALSAPLSYIGGATGVKGGGAIGGSLGGALGTALGGGSPAAGAASGTTTGVGAGSMPGLSSLVSMYQGGSTPNSTQAQQIAAKLKQQLAQQAQQQPEQQQQAQEESDYLDRLVAAISAREAGAKPATPDASAQQRAAAAG